MDSYLTSLLARLPLVRLDPFVMHQELARIRLLYHISFRRILGVERVLLSPDPTLLRLWRSIHFPISLAAASVFAASVTRRRR